MLCAYNQELISRMLDEDLSPAELHALREHLPHCAACSALYESFQALSRALEGQLEEPPASLRTELMAQLRREDIRRRNQLSRPVKIVLSTAACLALVLGLTLGSGLLPQRPSSAASQNSALLAGAKNAMPAREAADAAAEERLFDAASPAQTAPEAAVEEAAASGVHAAAAAEDAALPVFDLREKLTLDQLEELLGPPALVDLESLAELQPLYRLLVAKGADSVAVDCYLLDGALLYSMDAQPLRLAECGPEALDALLRDAR